ncbi:(S)-N-methylcoclaurine 3'-hydroxylase-like protein [Salvia divinorum]|uniref:(S)-N-methylcoclaurine 3'-hydroxylase-like protein n=1 Tax=Salvia divinorum TaxID=28513 RepID=A0ABD1HTI5_SALDI
MVMAEYFLNLEGNGINLLIIILLIAIPLFFLFFAIKKLKKSEDPPLPPGPNPWLIIGTIIISSVLTHIPFHISLTNLARTYGPLMHIKLGTQHLIVGSSPDAVVEILKVNDRQLSGRFVPHILPKTPTQIDTMSFWADSTSHHRKSLRALCRAELFAATALDRSARVRDEKAAELVTELRLKQGMNMMNVEEMVFATVVNMSSNAYFSRDVVVGFGENPMADILKGIGEAFEAKNLPDLYPFLRVLGFHGVRRKYMECSMKMWGIWEPIVNERRVSELKHFDFLDTLISRGFGDDQINHLLEDLFSGGIHTTSLTISKTITELLTSPHSIAKLRQELDSAFDGQDSITTISSKIDSLSYLQACIKETLRLHPPAPLMLAYRAYADCLIMNYTVPSGAQVLVNGWAIGRDPTVWEDPLQYRPERFLGSSIDFKGNNFEFLPFGAGRLKQGMNMMNVEEMVFATVVNMSSNAYFSRDVVVGFGENPMADILKGIGEAFEAKNLPDLYPFLRVLGFHGVRRKYMECSMKMWGIWEPIVNERRVSELKHFDFLDTLISRGFGDDQINHLLEDLFSGGIHTTSLTISKTITELLTSPHSIAKLRQELDSAFDGQDSITTISSKIDSLSYLQACIKETLRLHPPAPLMLAYRAYADCLIMNYTVPSGAQVLVNGWAIGRDPTVWEDPLQYRPERFLGSSIDFKGNNFEFLPFGAGRRICPGISMATKIVALVVATLIYFFDWPASIPTPTNIGPLLIAPRARK